MTYYKIVGMRGSTQLHAAMPAGSTAPNDLAAQLFYSLSFNFVGGLIELFIDAMQKILSRHLLTPQWPNRYIK